MPVSFEFGAASLAASCAKQPIDNAKTKNNRLAIVSETVGNRFFMMLLNSLNLKCSDQPFTTRFCNRKLAAHLVKQSTAPFESLASGETQGIYGSLISLI